MIIKSLAQTQGTPLAVEDPEGNWISRRLLLADDHMGFSLHDTLVNTGADCLLEYREHLEAVYCIEGSAELTDLATQQTHAITPGVMYALNQHDKHRLKVFDALRLVCVFSPALVGNETAVSGVFTAAVED